MIPGLREFRRPRLWLGLWCFGWLLCIVLSLAHPPSVGLDVPEGDKLGHLIAYGLLSAWAAGLFASLRARLLAALALVALGVALEFAQAAFTDDRMMEAADGWADLLGVILGQLAALGPLRGWLQRLDAMLFAA